MQYACLFGTSDDYWNVLENRFMFLIKVHRRWNLRLSVKFWTASDTSLVYPMTLKAVISFAWAFRPHTSSAAKACVDR